MKSRDVIVKDEEWLRQWTYPYEDRRALTTEPWRGEGHRWFRSPNVVPLENYRSPDEWFRICSAVWPRRW